MKNSTVHRISGNCTINPGTKSFTPINSMQAILGKVNDQGAICKVQADTVSLEVVTAPNQPVGIYTGTLTVDIPSFL